MSLWLLILGDENHLGEMIQDLLRNAYNDLVDCY